MPNSNRVHNHLINETSPYLLDHAHNPVNWYPWGDEALTKAKSENKLIFLSIGYHACHWCHVMERESFEDQEVANILNKYFISIKVDREERPDIDQIYMNYCQAATGRGGWPLTVLLTSDKKPFFAGTYFPKKSKHNMIGLIDLLEEANEKWESEQDSIITSANHIVTMLKKERTNDVEAEIDKDIYHKTYRYFLQSFDPLNGGFGKEPKFPSPHNILFLLRHFKAFNEEKALEMAEVTLIKMYKGGLFDHIGGGFSRYSTDRKWLVPHFEKMLYDNALLLMAYSEVFQITKKSIYKEIASKIVMYVTRNLRSDEGGFFCAEDADSEGIEGKFYVWSYQEILDLLGEEDGKLYAKFYNITEEGNFEGENIPNLIDTNIEETDKNPEMKIHLENLTINQTDKPCVFR